MKNSSGRKNQIHRSISILFLALRLRLHAAFDPGNRPSRLLASHVEIDVFPKIVEQQTFSTTAEINCLTPNKQTSKTQFRFLTLNPVLSPNQKQAGAGLD